MTDRPGTRIVVQAPEPLRPRDHADAARRLGDVAYLAWTLAQAAKLFLKLIEKRWPESA